MDEYYCEYAETCPIYALFNLPAGKVNLDMYCLGEFGQCKRRQMLLAGKDVPADMLPSGASMANQESRTHTIF